MSSDLKENNDASGNNIVENENHYNEVFNYINSNDIIKSIKELALEKKDTLNLKKDDGKLDLDSLFDLYGDNKTVILNIISGFMKTTKYLDINEDDIDKMMISIDRNELKKQFNEFITSPNMHLLNLFT